jgi:hypothetical protein
MPGVAPADGVGVPLWLPALAKLLLLLLPRLAGGRAPSSCCKLLCGLLPDLLPPALPGI